MKKSFKKSIAVLLSVLMMVCVMPFSAFAVEDVKPNVNLQFNTFSYVASGKSFQNYAAFRLGTYAKYGLYGAPLDYDKAAGTLTLSSAKAAATSTANSWGATTADHTYGVGDYFTVTVRLDNVSKIAATQVALNYSSNIEPAGWYPTSATNVSFYSVSENKAPSSYPTNENVAKAGYPIPSQSAETLYAGLNDGLVGDASYVDNDTHTIYTYVSNQNGESSTTITAQAASKKFTKADGTIGNTFENQAILATYAFKIMAAGPITFSVANPTDVDSCYYLADEAKGAAEDKYETYAETANAGSTGVTFMGRNENIAGQTYTVTFKNVDGSVISQTEYADGDTLTAPALPTKDSDATNHYTYAWDVTPATTVTEDATYTAVETAATHVFDDGVVTKEPTTTETGIKTYTCADCAYEKTETIDKLPEAHTHTWSAWHYNGDATYDVDAKVGTDGTQTRTCDCGAEETITAPNTGSLFRIANQLTIDASIIVKVLIPKATADYYDEVYMVAKYPSKEGEKTIIVQDTNDILQTYKRFSFENTMPHYMNEEVKYTFYGVKDGVTYWGDTYEYAVTSYIKSQLDKYETNSKYTNLKRLLADIIWYGYKAQLQQGYGITDGKQTPMTDYITAAQLARRTTGALDLVDITNAAYETIASPKAKTGFALRMGASVDLAITLAKNVSSCPALNTLQVEITKQGSAPEIYSYSTHPDMFATSGSYLNFYYNGVKGNEASVPVTVRLLDKDGNVISNTRLCSIESYCTSQINKATASQELKDVCDAIMRYAKSSATYIANKTA